MTVDREELKRLVGLHAVMSIQVDGEPFYFPNVTHIHYGGQPLEAPTCDPVEYSFSGSWTWRLGKYWQRRFEWRRRMANKRARRKPKYRSWLR